MAQPEPSFNLWNTPWITLEHPDGTLVEAGIEETLLRAGEFLTIYDPSPLIVVGIHRLLTAILQDALDPQRLPDLRSLWAAGRFPEDKVQAFGEQYAHRFDLFSEDAPFLQSADLPREPSKRARLKTATYLMPQMPAGSKVTHYRHGAAEDNVFCPTCIARGLLTIPAFATSGGAGIKPSINGVPPIYILPGGDSLFESLVASLMLPDYQPRAASTAEDSVWWKREPVVEHKSMVHEVSYLHSLTFPARRVRLHPKSLNRPCSRCGRESVWGVRTMIYMMGESRPKDAPFWFDPFAAYRIRGKKDPVPIRPREGKAVWREFAALFLPSPDEDEAKDHTQPPTVLYQLAHEGLCDDLFIYPFRCIGMRTDMKAKVFEWIDAGFDVPVSLIHDFEGGEEVRQALAFATDCARIITGTFRKTFGGEGKTKHHETLRRRMEDAYWTALSAPFRSFVLTVAEPEMRETARLTWVERVLTEAKQVFKDASEAVGSDAVSLRKRVTGRRICDIRLDKKRKEQMADE
jgi:CRISPR system Cascade subunit CasA